MHVIIYVVVLHSIADKELNVIQLHSADICKRLIQLHSAHICKRFTNMH